MSSTCLKHDDDKDYDYNDNTDDEEDYDEYDDDLTILIMYVPEKATQGQTARTILVVSFKGPPK